MKFCTHCGQQLSNESKFCTKCGININLNENAANQGDASGPIIARRQVRKTKPIFIIFLSVAVLVIGICVWAYLEYFKPISIVKNGYLGEYTNMTIEDFLEKSYGVLYERASWDYGETVSGKKVVEVKFQTDNEYIDDVVIQFEMIKNDCFKVCTYIDPMFNFDSIEEQLASLNYTYFMYNSDTAEKKRDFLKKAKNISGSSVMYGASSQYEGDRSKLYKLFDDDDLEMNVLQLLAAYHFLDLDEFLYEDIIEKYIKALKEEWNVDQLENAGMNYQFMYDHTLSEYGYIIMDFDYNGTDELFIGRTDEYAKSDGQFMDLYTMVNGTPTLVASSGERDYYYLCKDGFIENSGSSGASEAFTGFYSGIIDPGKLMFSEAIIYDDDMGRSSNPWYHAVGSMSPSNISRISESTAEQIINKHSHAYINYIPFDKF